MLVESLPEFAPQLSLLEGSEPNRVPPRLDDTSRRLVPARDDLRPFYVTANGLIIGKSGSLLQIKERQQQVQEVPIAEISQVNVFGHVQFNATAP
jgi:hypothetical protein